jgi:hypothetical protein
MQGDARVDRILPGAETSLVRYFMRKPIYLPRQARENIAKLENRRRLCRRAEGCPQGCATTRALLRSPRRSDTPHPFILSQISIVFVFRKPISMLCQDRLGTSGSGRNTQNRRGAFHHQGEGYHAHFLNVSAGGNAQGYVT